MAPKEVKEEMTILFIKVAQWLCDTIQRTYEAGLQPPLEGVLGHTVISALLCNSGRQMSCLFIFYDVNFVSVFIEYSAQSD